MNAVWTTILATRSYLPGVLVLAHGLRSVGSAYPLLVCVTTDLDQESRDVVRSAGLEMREVERLVPGGKNAGREKMAYERFRHVWTKLRAFELAEYEVHYLEQMPQSFLQMLIVDYQRVVQLDSDMIILKNMDELMDLELPEGWIAAAHVCACNPLKLPTYPSYWTPANCPYTPQRHPHAVTHPQPTSLESPIPYRSLNSGVFVLTPSTSLMRELETFLSEDPRIAEWAFADQDLLAAFYEGRWKPISWIYNALKTLRDIHADVWDDDSVKCLHFILKDKPWQSRESAFEVDKWWWKAYDAMIESMPDSVHKELVRSLVAS